MKEIDEIYVHRLRSPELMIVDEQELEEDRAYLRAMYPMRAKMILVMVEDACDRLEYEGSPMFAVYPDKVSMFAIAKKIYGADGVTYSAEADRAIAKIEEMGFADMPVCMAKNQYSLSDDAKKLGRPTGFTVNIREVYVSAGAGFVVAITGAIMTMPGLPKVPAAERIFVDDAGVTHGLF